MRDHFYNGLLKTLTLFTAVDLIELDRIAQTGRKHGERFFTHVYTTGELAYCDGHMSALTLSFAAKAHLKMGFHICALFPILKTRDSTHQRRL